MIMHAVRFRWSYPRHSSITCVTSNLQSCRNCQVMIVVPSRQCCGCDSSKPRVVCEDLGNPAFLKMSSLLPPDEWFEATGCSLDSPSLSPSEPLQCDRSPLKGKRYRHGSLADLVSRRSLPPGPRDLGELLNYPQSVVQVLFSDANRAHRCLTLLSQGLTDHSDYSGIAAEREAKRLLLQVLAEQYSVSVDCEYTKSCDIDPCCQQVLCHMSACLDNNASCVFSDIRDQIPEEGRAFCSELEPNPGDTWLSREEVEQHYGDIKAFLLKNSDWLVSEDRGPTHDSVMVGEALGFCDFCVVQWCSH